MIIELTPRRDFSIISGVAGLITSHEKDESTGKITLTISDAVWGGLTALQKDNARAALLAKFPNMTITVV